MNVTENDNTFDCDCGFTWQRGQSGAHSCEKGLREQRDELANRLAEATKPCAEQGMTRVRKAGGSFQHTGSVVSEFKTLAGEPRIVLEFDAPVAGMLHIYRPDQVEPLDEATELTKDEQRFLRHVCNYPGAKVQDLSWGNPDANGNNSALWKKLEDLGLIKVVGSYKWEPTAEGLRASREGGAV